MSGVSPSLKIYTSKRSKQRESELAQGKEKEVPMAERFIINFFQR